MWLLNLAAAIALGLLTGRFLNWLSGALIRAMEIQWQQEAQAQAILERQPGLLSLIWRQKLPVSQWATFCPASKASALMSVATAMLFITPFLLGANHQQFLIVPMGVLMLLMLRVDFEHFVLPDVLVFTLLWSGLLWAAAFNPEPQKAVIAAFGAYVSLYALAEGYSALRKIQMMGRGDYKLFAALAAWLDYPMIPMLLLGASVIMIVLWLAYYRRHEQAEMPFGPALILAGAALIITTTQPWLALAS